LIVTAWLSPGAPAPSMTGRLPGFARTEIGAVGVPAIDATN
jgi:hypothetical protein